MNHLHQIIFSIALLCALNVEAQLAVTIAPSTISEQKAVVPLILKNNFAGKIESARAICFLLDERGDMVGQSSKWVIGGKKDRPALEPKKGTTFNFVFTSQRFVSTNLTAKVSFSRVVLDGGKLADPSRDVQIQNGK